MSESDKTIVKTVKGPKAAVAQFIRPSDKKQIYVFTKRGEGVDAAIKRVMRANGATGGIYERCV